MGQTKEIVPADKEMYAARDITATVSCIPLIVGSIIGKKAAGNISWSITFGLLSNTSHVLELNYY